MRRLLPGISGGRSARLVAVLSRFLLVWIAAEATRFAAVAILILALPRGTHFSWTGAVAIATAVSLIGAAIVCVLLREHASDLAGRRWVAVAGIAAALIVRTLVSLRYHPRRVSDFAEYHSMALSCLQGGIQFSATRAIGYPIFLSWLFRAVGDRFSAAIVANVALAAISAALLGRLAGRFHAAGAAIWLFALFPAQVLMATVQGTEVLHGTLALLAIWLWTLSAPGSIAAAAAAGVALAAAQYVRPVSLLILPVLAAVPFVFRRRFKRPARTAMVLIIAFLAALSPVVVHNWRVERKFSFVAPARGGWSLLVGTNERFGGVWNLEDVALYQSLVGDRERQARRIAMDRIRSAPGSFAALAVRKFREFWGTEFWGADWAVGRGRGTPRLEIGYWQLLSQLYYLVVILLALIGVSRTRTDLSAESVAACLMLLAFAAAHTFLEVQGRYHFFAEILFVLLAAQAFSGRAKPSLSNGAEIQETGESVPQTPQALVSGS